MHTSLRAYSHQHASTTQRAAAGSRDVRGRAPLAASRLLTSFSRGPAGLGPCRLTNTQDELDPYRRDDDEYIELSQMQIPNPELGPLERRINVTYLEALDKDMTSTEDMEYWFKEPPGGWNQKPIRMKKATEILYEAPATGRNFGAGRLPLSSFYEGQELRGEVTRIMLYLGAQVDFGAEYDGLIPVKEAQWILGARDHLKLGTQVRFRIHAIRDTSWFRFPVQLELLDPQINEFISKPEDHVPPVDLRGKPSDLDTYVRMTGRKYNRYRYWAPTQEIEDEEDMGRGGAAGTGEDDEDFGPVPLSEAMQSQLRGLAAELM